MEFEIETGICNNCTGVDNCTKLCILHVGKALVDFITSITVVETRIGETSSRKPNTRPDLVVSGHQLYDMKAESVSQSWLLTDISTIIETSDKFLTAYGKTAFQIANLYCKHVNMSEEETKEITDKIKGINKNKFLLVPFRPRTNCNVDIVDNEGNIVDKKQEAEISYIKWTTNKETCKLNCMIGFAFDKKPSQKISIQDYLKRFRLSGIEMKVRGNKCDERLLSINDYGIFKPIIIDDGINSIAVDATYVYYISDTDVHIIGYWNNLNKLVIDKNFSSKAVTKLKDNETFIESHRKHIAPYMLYEPNVVKLRK